ncbi:hypothetical protein [Saccharospirillum mangrovi]|uniref:hypothetical protein n=1 Tax=Saccharospirillum mangrovi TaxID=2161747 RepID=UPI000D37CA03|nr:hypothetical protein [Saccharospirillum mangrovi]
MSFFAIIAIIFLIALMFGGVYVSRMAHQKEVEQEELREALRVRKSRQNKVEELFDTLMSYDRNPELLLHLQAMLVDDSQGLLELSPTDNNMQERLQYYQDLERTIDALGDKANQPQTPTSDREIHLIKRHFGRTAKLLNRRVTEGALSDGEAEVHIERLRRRTLELEAEAYQYQAVQARDGGDLAMAAAYYKHAKDMLINSDIHYPEKTEHIRKLSRLIAGLYTSEFDEADKASAKADQSSASKG